MLVDLLSSLEAGPSFCVSVRRIGRNDPEFIRHRFAGRFRVRLLQSKTQGRGMLQRLTPKVLPLPGKVTFLTLKS